MRTARPSFLSLFVCRLFGRNGLSLFLVSGIGLGLFLRGLFTHGLRGSVTHIGYLSLGGLLARGMIRFAASAELYEATGAL